VAGSVRHSTGALPTAVAGSMQARSGVGTLVAVMAPPRWTASIVAVTSRLGSSHL
jgi:hypothetical protein